MSNSKKDRNDRNFIFSDKDLDLDYLENKKEDIDEMPEAFKAYLNSLPNKVLTEHEEQKLFIQLRDKDEQIKKEARNKLIVYNLRLVVNNAKKLLL